MPKGIDFDPKLLQAFKVPQHLHGRANECPYCNGVGHFQFSADPEDGAFCEECQGSGMVPNKPKD